MQDRGGHSPVFWPPCQGRVSVRPACALHGAQCIGRRYGPSSVIKTRRVSLAAQSTLFCHPSRPAIRRPPAGATPLFPPPVRAFRVSSLGLPVTAVLYTLARPFPPPPSRSHPAPSRTAVSSATRVVSTLQRSGFSLWAARTSSSCSSSTEDSGSDISLCFRCSRGQRCEVYLNLFPVFSHLALDFGHLDVTPPHRTEWSFASRYNATVIAAARIWGKEGGGGGRRESTRENYDNRNDVIFTKNDSLVANIDLS